MPDGTSVQSFVDRFGACRHDLPGAGLSWLAALRQTGIERFAARGWPTRKVEAWKYTDLRRLNRTAFGPAGRAAVDIDRLPSLLPYGGSEHRLVFVDGCFRPDLSRLGALPTGVALDSLAGLLRQGGNGLADHLGRIAAADDRPLLALNTAMMGDGFVLRLGPNVVMDLPIEVVFVGTAAREPVSYFPRNLILVGPGSRATLIEHHVALGDQPYFANGGTEVRLDAGAALHHYKVQEEGPAAFHVATADVEVGRRGRYDAFILSAGARLARNEILVRLDGEDAECHLNGAYMLRDRQHCDNTTEIHHGAPRTACREVFKGVVDDQARGVFQGKIVVHRGAEKADGHMVSKALLLSDEAEVDTKPELEINADDVKCSHGATAGDLDRNALFYLRARGIAERAARNILIEAFLSEQIHSVAAEGLCPGLMASVGHWLSDTAQRKDTRI